VRLEWLAAVLLCATAVSAGRPDPAVAITEMRAAIVRQDFDTALRRAQDVSGAVVERLLKSPPQPVESKLPRLVRPGTGDPSYLDGMSNSDEWTYRRSPVWYATRARWIW
jgi:hypothetical protein